MIMYLLLGQMRQMKILLNRYVQSSCTQNVEISALIKSQVEDCQAYVSDFLPKALLALFYLPDEDIVKGTCSYYFDIFP